MHQLNSKAQKREALRKAMQKYYTNPENRIFETKMAEEGFVLENEV